MDIQRPLTAIKMKVCPLQDIAEQSQDPKQHKPVEAPLPGPQTQPSASVSPSKLGPVCLQFGEVPFIEPVYPTLRSPAVQEKITQWKQQMQNSAATLPRQDTSRSPVARDQQAAPLK